MLSFLPYQIFTKINDCRLSYWSPYFIRVWWKKLEGNPAHREIYWTKMNFKVTQTFGQSDNPGSWHWTTTLLLIYVSYRFFFYFSFTQIDFLNFISLFILCVFYIKHLCLLNYLDPLKTFFIQTKFQRWWIISLPAEYLGIIKITSGCGTTSLNNEVICYNFKIVYVEINTAPWDIYINIKIF